MSYVVLINKTKGINFGQLDFADSFVSRLMGLMFRKDPENGLILKLPSSRSKRGSAIHMFFMRFPLDIIFLDDDKKVVDMVSIRPWKTYTPRSPAKYVVELKEGSINNYKLEIGDEMDFTRECV